MSILMVCPMYVHMISQGLMDKGYVNSGNIYHIYLNAISIVCDRISYKYLVEILVRIMGQIYLTIGNSTVTSGHSI